jgi:inhibitor of KinA sporulation pathway (predicted exonuclease)
LEEAYSQIEADVRELKPFMNPLTWGGGDSAELRQQLGGAYDDQYVFGRRWIDVKTVFIAQQMARGEPFLGGLRKSMNRVGCRFEGKAHDALVDAENTFKMFRYLLARGV